MIFRKDKRIRVSIEQATHMIVGLGNPGQRFEGTRHNVGYMAVDRIAAQSGIPVKRLKFKSLYNLASFGGKRIVLLKPQTYMNLSGQAVQEAMAYYKIPPENVLLLFDEVLLDVGRIRLRRKGSDGGHNGMKSIIYLTGSQDFPRIKIGVGDRPHPDYNLADWVLSRFTGNELKVLEKTLDDVVAASELIIRGEMDQAMSKYTS